MIMVIALLAMLGSTEPFAEAPGPTAYKSVACDFFGADNAARLLGAKFRGEDEGMREDPEGRSWRCTFSRAADTSERSPKVYFMILKSPSDEAAAATFDTIRRSNNNKPGFHEWPGVADEAIVHSDAGSFYFVMVRKGVKSIRVKVRPVDGIALADLKNIASSLAAKL